MALDAILSLWYYCVVGMLLLAVAGFSLFSLYIHYVHWKYSHIPSPKRSSFYFGHLSDILKRRRDTGNDLIPLYEFHYQWYISAGSPVFVVHLLWKAIVFTTNPEDIKKIVMDPKNPKTEQYVRPLRSLYGERFLGNGLFNILDYPSWKPRRRVYNPAFKKGTLNSLVPAFNECVDRFLARLKPLADGETQVQMKVEFTDLTLDVISKVGFGSAFARQEWTREEFGLRKFQETGRLSLVLVNSMDGLQDILQSPFPELFPYLHPLKAEMYRETTRAIRQIARNCIETRLKDMQSGEPPSNDVLGSIVEAIKTGEEIDPEDLVDDFFTFYAAGQETVMSLLSSALLSLHLNPQVLERLLWEINEVLGDKEGVSVEDLEKLQFTEQVLQETLRLYPPAIGINKCAQEGGISLSGCHIPGGTTINMSTALLCRLPENFEDPEVFDPNHFNPDRKKPSSFVYFPFGVGHRSCIAKQFSMMEAKIILSRLLQTFRVSLPPDYKFVVAGRFTLQPKDAVPCTLETKL